MQIIATDILADMCGLSVGLLVTGIGIGLSLWLFGWWCHRFWIVLATTVLAGIGGLNAAPAFRAHPLVIGLLVALAAGLLALALIRLLAFTAGGLVGLFALQSLIPSWDQHLVSFLISGLLGLLLFRLCMMALTSAAGTLLITYCSLSLLEYGGSIRAIAWAEEQTLLLNGICAVMACIGVIIQFLMDRGRRPHQRGRYENTDWDNPLPRPHWLSSRSYRQAG